MPGRLTRSALWALVIRHARCSGGERLDPDQWFPVSADPGQARREAAGAIAICMTCPVRGHCLTLSLQHWDIGQHGIWGGLVAADRARLRRRGEKRAGQRPGSPLPGQPWPSAVRIPAEVIDHRRPRGSP